MNDVVHDHEMVEVEIYLMNRNLKENFVFFSVCFTFDILMNIFLWFQLVVVDDFDRMMNVVDDDYLDLEILFDDDFDFDYEKKDDDDYDVNVMNYENH